jgi:redox-sensitive bicupin YhaK (pirin superfamily)
MRTELSGAGHISHHKICVVYDGRAGHIVHVHESITIEGGEKATDERLERRARELASTHHKADPASLSVLLLDPNSLPDAEGPFVVDIKNKVIVQGPKQGPARAG